MNGRTMIKKFYNHQIGWPSKPGDNDNTLRQLYKTFNVHHKWRDTVNCGGVYNIEYSPDG